MSLPKSKTRTYKSWNAMRTRCNYPKTNGYKYYGGKGIRVCDRWAKSFGNFLADMGRRPQGKSLHRIDGDGDYEPSNCCWATMRQQQNSRSNNITKEERLLREHIRKHMKTKKQKQRALIRKRYKAFRKTHTRDAAILSTAQDFGLAFDTVKKIVDGTGCYRKGYKRRLGGDVDTKSGINNDCL